MDDWSAHVAGARRRIVIPLSLYCVAGLSAKTKLVLEYIDDANIYARIAKWYLRSKGFLSFELSYDVVNGGGGTTHDIFYAEVQKREALCLCVVDSDAAYPGCSLGDTSSKLDARKSEMTPVSDFLIIQAHEVENLIPPEVYKGLSGGDKTCQIILSHMESLLKQGKEECFLFLDIKKGVSHAAAGCDGSLYNYWATSASGSGCSVSCSQGKQCVCYIVRPWPKKAELKQWRRSEIEMPETANLALKQVWTEIGELMFNWCASFGIQSS